MREIVIVGASGFGRELAQQFLDATEGQPELCLKGFLDDDATKIGEFGTAEGVGVIGDTHTYEIQEDDRFLIGSGDPELRILLAERLAERGAKFFTLVHPRAYVASTAVVGDGCIIAPFANVGSHVRLNNHVLLNLYASAGHDSEIGACSVISPYGTVNGGSEIGDGAFVGSHAVVTPNVKVGQRSKVAAGAVVYRDVPEQSLASGNPAKTYPVGGQSSQ